MHLTQGQYKGFKIEVPKTAKPTLSKVRQGVFNMLNSMPDDNSDELTFLDMFSGSGLMGFEALSRGYKPTLIENNPKNIEVIKNNSKKFKIENKDNKIDIILANSLKFKSEKKFDIIYLDPPWDYDYLICISKALEFKKEDGIIIIEFDSTKDINIDKIIEEISQNKGIKLKKIKDKKYGRTLINFLK